MYELYLEKLSLAQRYLRELTVKSSTRARGS